MMANKQTINAQEAIAALNAFGVEINDDSTAALIAAYESGEHLLPGKSREYSAAHQVATMAAMNAEEELNAAVGKKMGPEDYYRIANLTPVELGSEQPQEVLPSDPIRRALYEGIYNNTPAQDPAQSLPDYEPDEARRLLKQALNPSEGV